MNTKSVTNLSTSIILKSSYGGDVMGLVAMHALCKKLLVCTLANDLTTLSTMVGTLTACVESRGRELGIGKGLIDNASSALDRAITEPNPSPHPEANTM